MREVEPSAIVGRPAINRAVVAEQKHALKRVVVDVEEPHLPRRDDVGRGCRHRDEQADEPVLRAQPQHRLLDTAEGALAVAILVVKQGCVALAPVDTVDLPVPRPPRDHVLARLAVEQLRVPDHVGPSRPGDGERGEAPQGLRLRFLVALEANDELVACQLGLGRDGEDQVVQRRRWAERGHSRDGAATRSADAATVADDPVAVQPLEGARAECLDDASQLDVGILTLHTLGRHETCEAWPDLVGGTHVQVDVDVEIALLPESDRYQVLESDVGQRLCRVGVVEQRTQVRQVPDPAARRDRDAQHTGARVVRPACRSRIHPSGPRVGPAQLSRLRAGALHLDGYEAHELSISPAPHKAADLARRVEGGHVARAAEQPASKVLLAIPIPERQTVAPLDLLVGAIGRLLEAHLPDSPCCLGNDPAAKRGPHGEQLLDGPER